VTGITGKGAGRSGPRLPIRRRVIAGLCCATLAVVAVSVAAGQSGKTSGRASSPPPSTPACAQAGKAIARPAEVPAAVVPPETTLASVSHPAAGMTLVTGVVPLQFRSAVEFFVTKLPSAGFRNTVGDAEMDEAESRFAGPGMTGKWKVNGILGCPDAVTLALYVRT
jgi:hypothetical protein